MLTMTASLAISTLCLLSHTSLAKMYEIYHRDHFHDFLQDLPVGSRFASVIAFYNNTSLCGKAMSGLPWTESNLPSQEHLFLGQFEMTTARDRVWYEWADHLDLAKYVGVEEYINSHDDCQCPLLVFIPSSYADELGDDYLRNPSTERIDFWSSGSEQRDSTDLEEELDWKSWVWKNMQQTVRIAMDMPFDLEVTIQHQTINSYLSTMGTPWTETVTIDGIRSHTELTVFPGDTIQITTDPKMTAEWKRQNYDPEDHDSGEDADGRNPIYQVHSAMDTLHVILLEDTTWGFDDDRNEAITPTLIRQRHTVTLMTHTRNLILPKVLPATHSLGFIKTKMPPGLHDRMVNFYRRFYHQKREEPWASDGTQLNFMSTRTHMVSLDLDSRESDRISEEVMKPVLLNWAHSNGWTNITDLKATSFYGIREYSRGASLRNHVDRVDTHTFSAVLQIAQSGVEEPWPLQVIDFNGKKHDITLEPGEMILYEGHKLIHGRPYPFNGTRFSNAFIHFAPTEWDWTSQTAFAHKIAKDMFKQLHTDVEEIYEH